MKRGSDEITFSLDEVTCVSCGAQMVWSDELCEFKCLQCETTAYQDETCGPDEIFYDSNND